MTSKEALEKIKNNSTEAGYEIAKSSGLKDTELVKTVVAKGKTYVIYPEEELNIIEKDLEVLEILKKCNFDIDYEDGYNDKFILGTRHYVGITQEEFNKIKEWLKNEI